MKALPLFALLAALPAFAFLPIPFELGASFLFAAGFFAIALRDYATPFRPACVWRAGTRPTAAAEPQKERFGLAA